jgi:hypothetical protein
MPSTKPRTKRPTKPLTDAKHPALTELYTAASRNKDGGVARTALALLSPAEREQHCPPGIQGKARKRFLTTGQTLTEQTELARIASANDLTTITVTKENTMPSTKTTEPKTTSRKRAAQPEKQSERTEKRAASEPLTAAQIARDAGIDGTEFRKYLRSQDVRKGGIKDKRHAARLVKGFKAAAAA